MISGIPVQHWIELREPLRKKAEQFLDDAGWPYEPVRIHFFASFDTTDLVQVAFDCARRLRPYRGHMIHVIMRLLQDHMQRNEWRKMVISNSTSPL